MRPEPFLRVEAYSLEPNRPSGGGRRKWSLSDSLAEVMRVPGHCDHVEQPLRPRILTSVSPDALLALARERAAGARDPLGRSVRKDGVVAASYVASYPVSWNDVGSSWAARRRYLRWRKRTSAFLLRELGSEACVVEHRDEGYPHLHGYAPAVLVPGVTNVGEPVRFLDIGPVDPGRRARNEVRRAGGDREAQNEAAASAYRDLHHRFARDVTLEFGFVAPGMAGPGRRRVDALTYRATREALAENERLKARITELEREQIYFEKRLVREAASGRRFGGGTEGILKARSDEAVLVAGAAQSRMGDYGPVERLEPDGAVSLLPPGTPGEGRIGRSLLRSAEEARGDRAAIARLSSQVLGLRRASVSAEARLTAAEAAAAEAALAAGARNEALLAEVARRDSLIAAEMRRSRQLSDELGPLQRVGEGLRNAIGRLAAADGPEQLAQALDPVAPHASALVRGLVARAAQLASRPTREDLDAAAAERDDAARRARVAEEEARVAGERAKAARDAEDEARRDLVLLQRELRDASELADREAAARGDAEGRAARAEEARRAAEGEVARLEAAMAGQLAGARAVGLADGRRAGRGEAAAALRQELVRLEISPGADPIATAIGEIKRARAAAATAEERAGTEQVAGVKTVPAEAPAPARDNRGLDRLAAEVRSAAAEVGGAALKLRAQAPQIYARITSRAEEAGQTWYEAAAAVTPEYQGSIARRPELGRVAQELDHACAALNLLSEGVHDRARALGGFEAPARAELRRAHHELLMQVAWIPPSKPGTPAPWEVVTEALGPARVPGSTAVLQAAGPALELEGVAERDLRLRHQTRELYADVTSTSTRPPQLRK
jgi:hypothetical protein